MRSTAPALPPLNIKNRSLLLRAVSIPIVLLLSACATRPPTSAPAASSTQVTSAEQSALRSLIAQQDRLYRVAAPLLVHNADLCKDHARNLLGFTAKNKYSYSSKLADTAQSLLGLDEHLQVMGVLSGSGAEKAGLRRGDKLLTVEGKPMPIGVSADRHAASMLAPLVAPAEGRSSLRLSVLRNNANLALNIPMTRACAYSIELGNADLVNAYSDGRRILITRGMLNVTPSDTELAYVVAKEIAHNALQHASRQNMSGTIGDIINNLIQIHPDMSGLAGTAGVKATPREMEAEADRLGLYMAARAGYPIEQAAQFWARLSRQYPAAVLNSYTAIHPDTAGRMSTIERTTLEIRAKQAARQPLNP